MTLEEVQELDESQRLNFTHRRAQWVVSHARQLQQKDDPGLLAPLTKRELAATTRLMATAMAGYETDWVQRMADDVAREVRREAVEILQMFVAHGKVTDHTFTEVYHDYELGDLTSCLTVRFGTVEEQPEGRPDS